MKEYLLRIVSEEKNRQTKTQNTSNVESCIGS